jgi:hypothetical protein
MIGRAAYGLLFCMALTGIPARAAPSVTGEYLCDGCHGYLTIKQLRLKKTGPETYQIWLGSGGGSCGGTEFAKGVYPLARPNTFSIKWKQRRQSCFTHIEIKGNKASVSDSCIKPEDEENSTCAVLGDYTKRAK